MSNKKVVYHIGRRSDGAAIRGYFARDYTTESEPLAIIAADRRFGHLYTVVPAEPYVSRQSRR